MLLAWGDYCFNYSRGTSFGALRRFFNIAQEDGAASWFAVTQFHERIGSVWGRLRAQAVTGE